MWGLKGPAAQDLARRAAEIVEIHFAAPAPHPVLTPGYASMRRSHARGAAASVPVGVRRREVRIEPDAESSSPAEDGAMESAAAASRASAPIAEAQFEAPDLNNPKPPYPIAARRRGLEGRVLLSARVSPDGSCAGVQLRRSSGHALLDDAALATVRRWRFLPARRGAQAIESWVEVPVRFRLER